MKQANLEKVERENLSRARMSSLYKNAQLQILEYDLEMPTENTSRIFSPLLSPEQRENLQQFRDLGRKQIHTRPISVNKQNNIIPFKSNFMTAIHS